MYLLVDELFGARWLHYLFSTAITLVTVLMNWPPVFHLQWLGHVPHVRQHLPTTIVWNSPMQELIGSVMVSSLLLPTFGTLSLPLYFRLPSTFLPSKGRSITTLGARWHDFFFFFYTFQMIFINSFWIFYKIVLLHFFSFFCAPFCVPIHKKKKKKKTTHEPSSMDTIAKGPVVAAQYVMTQGV